MRYSCILLALFCLSIAGCDRSGKGGPSVIVLEQIRQYSSEDEPHTTGCKFYHIKGNGSYKKAVISEIKGGDIKELASQDLVADSSQDDYISLSFFTERDGAEWWAWCQRGPVKQLVIHQGEIGEGWRLAQGSWNRKVTLEGDEVLIDIIIFCRAGKPFEMGIIDDIYTCRSIQEVAAVTKMFPDCRVAVMTVAKE